MTIDLPLHVHLLPTLCGNIHLHHRQPHFAYSSEGLAGPQVSPLYRAQSLLPVVRLSKTDRLAKYRNRIQGL